MLDLFAIKTNKFKKEECLGNIREEVINSLFEIFLEPCREKGLTLENFVAPNVPTLLILDV